METIFRACNICNKSIQNKRLDAKTCSSSCRSKLFRSNKAKAVLVRLRIPNDVYTDLAIKAFQAQKSLNDFIVQLVVKQ